MLDTILFITIVLVIVNIMYVVRLYFLNKNIKKSSNEQEKEMLYKKFVKETIICVIIGFVIFIFQVMRITIRIFY